MMEESRSDKIILACIGFMVGTLILGQMIPYDDSIPRTVINALWFFMPLVLSFAIKDPKLRPYGVAGGAIYALYHIYLKLIIAIEGGLLL